MQAQSELRLHWSRRLHRYVHKQISPISFSITMDDHDVVARALQIRPGDKIACLASAGDAPLNLLVHDPAVVDAIDISAPQLHLMQLKMTAAATLGLNGLRDVLGAGTSNDILGLYGLIREELPVASREFWDAHTGILARGVMWEGAVVRLARSASPVAIFRARAAGHMDRIEENPYLTPFLLRKMPPEPFFPPYLSMAAFDVMRSRLDRIQIVHADIRQYLRRRDDNSIDGFALSNVLDWLTVPDTHLLLEEIVRVGKPGAAALVCAHRRRLTVPDRLSALLTVDRAEGDRLRSVDRVKYFRYIDVVRVKDSGAT